MTVEPVAPQVPQAPTPAPRRMKKIMLILVGGIVVVVLIVAIYWFIRSRAQREAAVLPEEAPQVVEEEVPYVDPFPNDLDRDGIPNDQEAELGTSDVDFDTDGDAISDADEMNFWKTDPTKPDTDGDGFADGWEVISGYNPNGEGKLE
ncbi:MAG: hypothetical protein A3C90_00975 [Candidatus Magasanikbacteria bacterium RIFCSPHIGHO2_02_FULL_51_14]|uniref:Uncharacterized protein n=1 Tax=Candidatus Magasanikbacteria bacterium RIFCSPHIGHO2_02_FULL_51_14 TaxID=1798683 RepID=A0A1F6MPY3_9BACT|nr:MAG: hypothetical protein A3C90_00975 [Candidatus Magasanikbacteria bacterium RIFCSPHIGHO2_02_FULL_51_14]